VLRHTRPLCCSFTRINCRAIERRLPRFVTRLVVDCVALSLTRRYPHVVT
jgi:hypothetical protein